MGCQMRHRQTGLRLSAWRFTRQTPPGNTGIGFGRWLCFVTGPLIHYSSLSVYVGTKILKCVDLHRRHLPTMEATLAAARAAQTLAIAGASQSVTTGVLFQGPQLGGAAAHDGGGQLLRLHSESSFAVFDPLS